MSNHRQQRSYIVNNARGFFAGLLLGSLIGAVAMLLLAPQSGEKTRAKIQEEGRGLRDQVSDTVEDVVLPARSKARRVMADVRRQAKDLEQRGQDMVDEQEEIVSQVVDAEKTAAHNITKG
jgi:gas vesicle protein